MDKKKYDSKFEEDLHKGPLSNCEYHPSHITYTVPERQAKYTPDFKVSKDHVIEAKGRFRSSAEAKKYIWVRDCNPGLIIEFVFYDPDKPMPGAKRRKDGTIYTHEEWAESNGFKWSTYPNLRGNKRGRTRRKGRKI